MDMDLSRLLDGPQCRQTATPIAANTPSTSTSSFKLHDLPKELVDNIYDFALLPSSTFKLPSISRFPEEELSFDQVPPYLGNTHAGAAELVERHAQTRPALNASVRYRPQTDLLLASRTIRAGYEQRANLAMTLVLKDNEKYAFQLFTLPPQVLQVRRLELHVILFCHQCRHMPHMDYRTCQAAREISHHTAWIENLLSQLTNLRKFTIDAYLSLDRASMDSKEKPPCEPFVRRKVKDWYALPKLQRLTLARYDFTTYPDLEGPRLEMFEWKPHTGEKEAVEESEVATSTASDEAVAGSPSEEEKLQASTLVWSELMAGLSA